MRCLLFSLSLLIVSPSVLAQQQYSEGACILLQQQIDRFSQQRQNSNYRSARREYDRYCSKPVQAVPRGRQAQQAIPVDTTATKQTLAEPAMPVQAMPQPIVVTPVADDATAEDTRLEPPVGAAEVLAPEQAAVASEPAVVPEQVAPVQAEITEPVVPAAVQPIAIQHTAQPVPVADNARVAEDLLLQILNNIPLIAANIVALLLAVFLLTSWLGYNLPGFKGAFAEYKLNRLLRWRLSKQYQHFRKLKLFTEKDELTEIDHLVLCPYGIFVIAVKSNRGRISGTETGANWSRHYFGNTRQLMNPLHQNYKNVAAVKHLLQLQSTDTAQAVHSVIAFNRVAQFVSSMPANVLYVDAVATYLKQFNEPVLSEEQLSRFAAVLKQASTA